MIVTVNTDASFSHHHKRGSYAFWIVSNEFKILKSGILRKKVGRPEVAEIMCILNALHCLRIQDTSRVTRVIVNTDCLNAIHILSYDKANIQRYRLSMLAAKYRPIYNEIINHSNFTAKIEFRHVKAHSGVDDARSYVNEWCDTQAKLHIRSLRKEKALT